MGISQFIGKKKGKSSEANLLDKFVKMSKGMDKAGLRKLEQSLFRPRPLPPYRGKKPGLTSFKQRTIRMSFSSPEAVKMIGQIIKLNSYVENNTYDTLMVEALFKLIRDKKIKWNKERKRFKVKIGGSWKWI